MDYIIDIIAHLENFCNQTGLEKTYWIAYSGGLDSHTLLFLFAQLQKKIAINLRAVHVNHHLHSNANEWTKHCARVCADFNIDLTLLNIQVDAGGNSLEAVAREKRYAAIATYIHSNDVLLTAHHQDDQAETVLLQLFRGAGIKGLSSMPCIKPFANGLHARPLLHLSRQQLQTIALDSQLQWIDDTSNNDNQLSRNFIRHQTIAHLQSRWPSITRTLSRCANHFAETQLLLNEFAHDVYHSVQGSETNTVSIPQLILLSSAKQKLVLRFWIEKNNFPLPSTKKLHSILQTILIAKPDRNPFVVWGDTIVRRYRDHLYIDHLPKPSEPLQDVVWQIETPLQFASQIYVAKHSLGKGIRNTIQQVLVRFRKGGETLQLNQNTQTTLKHFFQSKAIAPWLRNQIPLLYVEDHLICIPNLFIDARYRAKENELGWEIM